MENELYKMMIRNAAYKLRSQDPLKPKEDDIDIFNVAFVLATLLSKRSADIIADILNVE